MRYRVLILLYRRDERLAMWFTRLLALQRSWGWARVALASSISTLLLSSPPTLWGLPPPTHPNFHTHIHRRSGSADKVNCRTCTFVDCTRVRQWPAQRVYINTGDTHNPRNYHTQPCAVLRLPSFIQSARKVEPRSKRRKKTISV